MTTPLAVETTRRPSRDWIGVVPVVVMWGFWLAGWLLDIQSPAWFLISMAAYLLMTLTFLGWWFTRRSFTRSQHFLVLASAILLGILIRRLSMRAITEPTFLIFSGLPILLAAWTAWVIATRRQPPRVRTAGLIACLAVAWSAFLLIRLNGFQGNLRADVHWRWTPTAEEIYLAQRPMHPTTTATTLPSDRRLDLRPGDWPGFRGPDRDGVVHNLRISLDWSQAPPTVLWRQRVGPAWSSMTVVDGCLFTQEQRGEREAVVCRDALTGVEIWVHDDPGRFEEAMSGA